MTNDPRITTVLALLLCSCYATQPGVKVRLSQPGLNYAASAAVDIVSGHVQGMKIPDQSGQAHVKVGKVSYEVKNMKITSFQKPSTSVTMKPGSGLAWSLSNAAISIHGDWRYEYRAGFIKIRDHGSFDASASGVSISVSVAIGRAQDGHPTISSTGCSSSIAHLDLHIHGGASWFYDLFMHFVEKPIRDNLQKQMCAAARDAVNKDAARELATLKVKVIIDKRWLLDYGLVSAPQFTAGYMESSHKGEFFYADDPKEAPFQPAPMPSPTKVGHMAEFWLSEYVLNTAGYVLQEHAVLRYNLTKKDLPAADKAKLNTTCGLAECIGSWIPAIGKTYPNAAVEAEMFTTVAPNASIDSSNVTGRFAGNVVLRARLTNGSLAPLLTLKVAASISIRPRLEGTVIKGTLTSMDEALSVADSKIGPVSITLLKMFFDLAKNKFIIPQLQKVGAKGFPLPTVEHVEFVNTALQLQPHCIVVMTDVRYKQKSKTLYFES